MGRNNQFRLYRSVIIVASVTLLLVLSLVYVLVTLLNLSNAHLPLWLAALANFLTALYPNVILIPLTFLGTVFFLRPLSQKEQEEQEARFLENIDARIATRISESIIRAQTASQSLVQSGIVDVFPSFDDRLWGQRMAQASKRICILENWICASLPEYKEAFRQAALKRLPLQIILLDPDSACAKQRSCDLGHDESYVPHEIRANLNVLKRLQKEYGLQTLEVRLHTSLPSVQLFLCDERALVGYFLHGTESKNVPQLDILVKNERQEYTAFGARIEAEFTAVWKAATPIIQATKPGKART